MDNILVSIITVCYNSEKTIEGTIQSVLNQTYSNIEYIIVDGASQDATLDIVREYEAAFAGRMKLISEPDHGIYDAMNKGIKCARGELVGIINSDDYYEKDAVEKMVSHMSRDKLQILYGVTRALRDGVEDSISIYSHHFLQYRTISHPSCFVTKKVYDTYGGYDTKYSYVADYDFMLRMKKELSVEFLPVYEMIANYRVGGASASGAAYAELIRLRKDHDIINKWKYYRIKMRSFLGL